MADNLTPEQRSRTMSRIRSTDTGPELTIRRILHARGRRFRKYVREVPGRPDLVFARERVAVFVDGDFWHGWRFPVWREKLAEYWRLKIARNRQRDARNFRLLRRRGWVVIRIWEHQVENDPHGCVERVERALGRMGIPSSEANRTAAVRAACGGPSDRRIRSSRQ
jgi:DNA mismatch endonuclease (patch repair protein)